MAGPLSFHEPRRTAAQAEGAAAGIGVDIRHSRRVALLKRVLPATGLAMLLLIAMWPRLTPVFEKFRLGLPAIDLRDARELRMINPRYAGIDRRGHPFVVTAAVGRQVPERQDLLSLQKPRAVIQTHPGKDIVVTATRGIYQQQAQLLDLFDAVNLVQQNGSHFVTDRARVDVVHDTAEGSDPVAGHGPSGDIKAQGFRILDRGNAILFTGRADLRLVTAKTGAAPAAPAALPAPVAAAAARTLTEARPVLRAAARAHADRRLASARRERHAGAHRRPARRHHAVRAEAARQR